LNQLNQSINQINSLDAINTLAAFYSTQRKYDKAEPLYLECLNNRKVLLGDGSC
jgi:hypothetical protein